MKSFIRYVEIDPTSYYQHGEIQNLKRLVMNNLWTLKNHKLSTTKNKVKRLLRNR